MKRLLLLSISACALLAIAAAGCVTSGEVTPADRTALSPRTALDKYVHTPDPVYHFELVNTIEANGLTAYNIDLTSQTWLTPAEVDRTEWKHWLTIVKPPAVKHSTAFLFIGGGANGKEAPTARDLRLVGQIAQATQSIVAELRQVPNQPLTFTGDHPRTEDALIAYTWDKYLRTGDERWPARLPMTKSAVRAMDTITAFCASEQGGGLNIDSFVVGGGSKRGWTTWTTGAVDNRVVAVVPIVIDMLNLEKSFQHHWEAYGFWAPAVGDYVEMGIMDWQGSVEYAKLLEIVEPYSYRARMTIPKFIMNSCGDQFFLPDSSQFYFDDLPGEKYLRYVPNSDHGLDGSDALESLVAYYYAFLNGIPRPQFSWTQRDDGAIVVTAKDKPAAVKLWRADSDARDFRKEKIGAAWVSEDLTDQGGGVYIGKTDTPPQGYRAYLVELTYPVANGVPPMKFTTNVEITPDTLPFAGTMPPGTKGTRK